MSTSERAGSAGERGIGFNPRYAAYAAAHGRTPEQMLAHDKERIPSACMIEFVFWNTDQWTKWAASVGHPRAKDIYAIIGPQDHVAYDAWLAATFTVTGQQRLPL